MQYVHGSLSGTSTKSSHYLVGDNRNINSSKKSRSWNRIQVYFYQNKIQIRTDTT